MKTLPLTGFLRLKGAKQKFSTVQKVTKALHIKESLQWTGEELCVYRPAASNFPFIDFATGCRSWYNAKSIWKYIKTVKVGEDGVRRFLDNLEKAWVALNSSGDIKSIAMHSNPVLTVVSNCNAEASLREPTAALGFLCKRVTLRVVNVSEMSAVTNVHSWNCIKRRKALIDGLQRQQSIELGRPVSD